MATFFFISGVIICGLVLFGLFFVLIYLFDRSGTWRRGGGTPNVASGGADTLPYVGSGLVGGEPGGSLDSPNDTPGWDAGGGSSGGDWSDSGSGDSGSSSDSGGADSGGGDAAGGY